MFPGEFWEEGVKIREYLVNKGFFYIVPFHRDCSCIMVWQLLSVKGSRGMSIAVGGDTPTDYLMSLVELYQSPKQLLVLRVFYLRRD